jgi:multiple sugar transport system ATP-binding protein
VTAGQKVTFGLRPDDLYPAGHGIHSGEDADVHRQDLRVILTEPLGNETLVFSDFAGAEWVGRMLNPRRLSPGEALSFCFDLSQAHLFDRESGRTLRG